jgi:hypothetical protein
MSKKNQNFNPYFWGIVIIVSSCVIAAGLYASRRIDEPISNLEVKGWSSQPRMKNKPEKPTSAIDAKAVAVRKFEAYSPKIVNSKDAAIGASEAFTGDLNSDGMTDAVVFFVLTPKEGGNMVLGQGLAVYINQGNDMKVVAGFEPDYSFRVEGINEGKLHIVRLDYAENNQLNRPSFETHKYFILNGRKLQESNTFD